MVAATLAFDGSKREVEEQEKLIYSIAAKYQGMPAGAASAERGYYLTFGICYIRDHGLCFYSVSESVEAFVSWTNVKNCLART